MIRWVRVAAASVAVVACVVAQGMAIDRPLFLCDWPVPLEHPRHYSMKTTPVFSELKARLTEEIRIEVQRAAGLWAPA